MRVRDAESAARRPWMSAKTKTELAVRYPCGISTRVHTEKDGQTETDKTGQRVASNEAGDARTD